MAAFLNSAFTLPWPPSEQQLISDIVARVTTRAIYIYQEPSFQSDRLGTLRRDQLVYPTEEIISTDGPAHNPRWYRLIQGFVHSAYLQRVERTQLNKPLRWAPEDGWLGEISVPYTQSFRPTRTYGWVRLYRLYYGSVHWITEVLEGPDGTPWYAFTDELLHIQYCVPARHVRPVMPDELSPLSPDVPAKEKRLAVSLAEQRLTAYEGDKVVFQTRVSTGIPNLPTWNDIPTATPKGHFRISVKMPSKHMGDGDLTDDIEAYELLGVPWVSFFHKEGYAFHGTYWHDNFGRIMSHGCVNMRNQDALWLYRWTTPAAGPYNWVSKGSGTTIDIT